MSGGEPVVWSGVWNSHRTGLDSRVRKVPREPGEDFLKGQSSEVDPGPGGEGRAGKACVLCGLWLLKPLHVGWEGGQHGAVTFLNLAFYVPPCPHT